MSEVNILLIRKINYDIFVYELIINNFGVSVMQNKYIFNGIYYFYLIKIFTNIE